MHVSRNTNVSVKRKPYSLVGMEIRTTWGCRRDNHPDSSTTP